MYILATAPADPAGVLIQYGVLGVIVLVLGPVCYLAYKREQKAADEARAALQVANDRLIAMSQQAAERFAEVLAQTRDALTASNDYLRDLARRRS
jgi:hypothetical protein